MSRIFMWFNNKNIVKILHLIVVYIPFLIFLFLTDIPYLRELALNNNPLSKVEAHAFEMVPQIVALDVSGINEIQNDARISMFLIDNFRLRNKENIRPCISKYKTTWATLPP